MKTIKVFAPATVANVGCGFDILGFALDAPGDELWVSLNDTKTLRLFNNTPYQFPCEPEKNVSGVALKAMLDALKSEQGFDITFVKKIPAGSGIGSSAASAAAVVVAANELLNQPFTREELVYFAMQGELAASGSAHADNVAPAVLGGFTLVRSYTPFDVVSLPCPADLYCAAVLPDIEIKTKESRSILPVQIPLKKAVMQWGNVAGLVAGICTGNLPLIGRSIEDVIVEPVRSALIPSFFEVKKAALDNGALGCSISGSGPSIFALCDSKETAQKVGEAMIEVFNRIALKATLYVSPINKKGTIILGSE